MGLASRYPPLQTGAMRCPTLMAVLLAGLLASPAQDFPAEGLASLKDWFIRKVPVWSY